MKLLSLVLKFVVLVVLVRKTPGKTADRLLFWENTAGDAYCGSSVVLKKPMRSGGRGKGGRRVLMNRQRLVKSFTRYQSSCLSEAMGLFRITTYRMLLVPLPASPLRFLRYTLIPQQSYVLPRRTRCYNIACPHNVPAAFP